nr:MAG TPA: tail tape measure protein [Bacteriophage sp.]
MHTIADLLIKIGADTSSLRKELNATKKQMKTAFGGNALDFSKDIVTGVAAAGAALSGLGVYAVKLAGNFQNAQVAFTNMLGSADKANAFIADLQQFAAKTPFNFSGLTQASQKMLAYGFTADQILPTLTAVGDAAAGLGAGQEGIDRITLALGQMGAKGKVSAEEMRQLTETGLPAWQMLADKMGTSIADAMDQVTKGTVSAQTGITAMVEGMESKFGGLMDQQSGTIQGSWSNLMDSLEQSSTQLGLRISEALNLPEVFGQLSTVIQNFANDLQSSGITAALNNLIPPGLQVAIVAVAGAVTGAMIPALVSMAIAAAAALVPLLPYMAVGAAVAVAIYTIVDPVGALTALLDALGVSSDTTASIIGGLTSAFDAVAGAVDYVIDVFYGIGAAISEYVSPYIEMAESAFEYLWSAITGYASDIWQSVTDMATNIANAIGDTVSAFLDMAYNALPDWAQTCLSSIGNMVTTAIGWLASLRDYLASTMDEVAQKGAAARSGGDAALVDSSLDVTMQTHHDAAQAAPVIPDYSNFAGIGDGSESGGKPKKGKSGSRGTKLADEAKRVTKSIADAWTNMFGTEQDQADQWYADQIENLDKSKSANSNYDADLQKLNEIYWQKQAKADQAAAEQKIKLYKQIHDSAIDSMSAQNVYGTASQQAIKTMEMDYTKSIDNIKAKWQEYETDYIGMTNRERQQLLQALSDEGIAYETTEDGRLSLAKQTAADIAAANKKYDDQITAYHAQAKDLQADVDDAYSKNSLSALRDALTAERAERLASYNEQQSVMQAFYDNWITLNETTQSKIMSIIDSSKQSFQTFFEDILGGSKSFGDSLIDLFDNVWKSIIDNFTASWTAGISNKLMSMMGLLGDSGGTESNNGLGTGDAITGVIGQASVGDQSGSGAITGMPAAAPAATSALSLFGGSATTGSALLAGYNAVQGIIKATTKPAEATETAAATGALTGLTTAAISASAALAAMSVKSSLGLFGFASGGYISGPGSSTSDSIPAALSNGEYVLSADAVSRLGVPALNALNSGRIPRFAAGGLVTRTVGTINTDAMSAVSSVASPGRSAAGGSTRPVQQVNLSISTMDASSFSDFLSRGGFDVIKQKLFDSNREFAGTAGVW